MRAILYLHQLTYKGNSLSNCVTLMSMDHGLDFATDHACLLTVREIIKGRLGD